ncbi:MULTISPECIES: MBL fold metallo-hydrolase RNA specificity domain-containing protein [unclassified Shewanella]|uniref:MBL fold metallo-hydrolase RNA specificity domain-containing protein n=1 Tax=unclassified Shewanella TaxID=196818 RepID=UPI001BC6F58C|nr:MULTISPECIES: MBL fold metallo-hydrolase [unclassified Shewanella]GIU18083.1 MBL fold hydrolase [Shewanella sp. MBTL60-112-B1]GIU38922.1 MBL fold hydrolase [Shewanella sp. MBTL60-112-B2]
MQIIHYGAVNGVTGSCHQLDINPRSSVLIDCGLFQGAETAGKSAADQLQIEFELRDITALIITHCHIDHVGRIPYLLAAGFNKPIYATTATAALLPMVIEDALKVGVTRNQNLINLYLKRLQQLIQPIDYNQWFTLNVNLCDSGYQQTKARFNVAGHILGSAYVEIELSNLSLAHKNSSDDTNPNGDPGSEQDTHIVVFSGDLGASNTPLLPSPQSPLRADILVIESTYGDKNHVNREQRAESLRQVIEKSVSDNGVVLIPAFSIGRTQELLYELEQIIHNQQQDPMWQSIDIIVDSPMAANFTEKYIDYKKLWDSEAKSVLAEQRHPLDFNQLYTIDSHQDHLAVINYLSSRQKPAVVIAASGMCTGGRIVNYLQRFLPEPTADVLFVGYQATGTIGRDIQTYGPRGGYVYIEGEKIDIKAGIHTISGYSAHADQQDLINFVEGIKHKPKHIRIVHGDTEAKQALADKYRQLLPNAEIKIGTG